jgi:putative ABC transport system ATP-binding protein
MSSSLDDKETTMSQHPAPGGAIAQMSGVSVTAHQLIKRYGTGTAEVVALDAVDLTVRAAEAVALMGPSGSGKSTLLHLVGAMDVPTSGTLTVDRTDISALRGDAAAEYRRSVGFVFQGFHLLAALSALDNVLAPLIPTRKARSGEQHAREVLELVGLGDRLDALPSELSGGQRQRVAIARALVNTPRVILADEPTGNLDSVTGDGVIELLLSLRERFGTTLLLATHDQRIADRLDRTVQLLDGRINPTA